MKHLNRFLLTLFALTLTIQLVGCGAAEVSSAKLYRNQRNYIKANEMLEKAIVSDPTNDEAWALYVQNLYDLRNYEKIADVIDTAKFYGGRFLPDINAVQYNTWVELYNGAVSAYNQNPDDKEIQKSAINNLVAAQRLIPDQPETYELLGQVYMQSGDTAKGIATYNQALQQVQPMHDRGMGLGLALRMSPDAAQKAMGGAPAAQTYSLVSNSDSALVYSYPAKQAWLYFEHPPKKPRVWELTGWRFTDVETSGKQPMRVSLNTYETIANYYYRRGLDRLNAGNKAAAQQEFDRAIPILVKLQQIDPSDEFAAQAIPDIYQRLNRLDLAKAQYEKMLQDHPTKANYVNYGTLLMSLNDFPGAAAAFEKSLQTDPNYESGLFNLGATYKNWAASEQKAKRDWKSKVEKSTEYFERYHQINHTDFNVLANLVDNYDLLGKKDKQQDMLKELESLKGTEASNDPDYWTNLAKLYARFNRPNESADAFKKADQLKH